MSLKLVYQFRGESRVSRTRLSVDVEMGWMMVCEMVDDQWMN